MLFTLLIVGRWVVQIGNILLLLILKPRASVTNARVVKREASAADVKE